MIGIKILDKKEFDIESCIPEFECDFHIDAHGDIEMGDSYIGRNDTMALAKHFKITQDEIEGFGT